MLSYSAFTEYFGYSLSDKDFQLFLQSTFSDLSEYDILESNYLSSETAGVELGFKNPDAMYDEDDKIVFEKGNPVFSYLNIFPKASKILEQLPFAVDFSDKRAEVIKKAGSPLRTNQGYMPLLNANFLVDRYESDGIIMVFDYNAQMQTLNFIQISGKNLA